MRPFRGVKPRLKTVRTFACQSLAVIALSALAGLPFASAEQRVKFESAARSIEQGGAPAAIQGYLSKPKGDGPFPAVVLLHNCLGLPADRGTIGERFANWGYVALFVDDFTTRGVKETCAVDFPEGVADAFGALAYLSRLLYVDSGRIAAIGWSQGADTALDIASIRFASAYAVPDGLRFRAAAALYPPCENQSGAQMRIPTLILVGGADGVTPAADCERLAKAQSRDGVKLVVYRGAEHGFDEPEYAGGKHLLGMELKYDRDAAERSRAELREFLAARLAR